MRKTNNGKQAPYGQSGVSGVGVLEKPVEASGISREEIASFFDLVPSPVFIMDLAHTVLYINDEATRFFGRSREECVGKKYWDLFDCPGCREGTCAAAKAVRTGAVCSGETVGMLRGKETPVRVLAAPRRDSNGQTIGCVQLIVDSTVQAIVAKYLHTIANGEVPAKVTDEFNGAYENVKTSMNTLVDMVTMRGQDMQALSDAILAGRLSFRPDSAKYKGYSGKMIEGVNRMLDAVIDPLNVAARCVDQISKGEIPEKISQPYAGDFNAIKNNLNACIDGLNSLQGAAGVLKGMAVNDYSKRVEGSASGIYGEVAQAVNAVHERINHLASTVNRVSTGDLSELPEYVKIGRRSENDLLVPSLIALMKNLQALVAETDGLIKASTEGKLDTRADASKHHGDYGKIVKGVNEMLDAILLPIGEGNRILAQISNGKIDELIAQTYQGDHEKMKLAVNNVAVVMQNLQKELARLTEASRDGQLAERGKADQFQGSYAGIVKGVNEMLDAILLPIGEGNRILAQISNGKIDELIAQTYKGDHEKMKLAVNNVAVVMQGLQKELARLTEASRDGQLAERGKADQFQGSYAGIVKGVNEMLDAILLPIGEGNRILAQISNGKIDELIAQTYKGDHEKMKVAVNNVGLALQHMSKDVTLLVEASVEGRLSTRADATKHKGDYRKVVEGVNATLDAILEPIREAAEVIERIAGQDLTARVEGKYRGDHAAIKDNINRMAVDLRSSLQQIAQSASVLASAAEELTSTSHQMAGNAEETATQANVVSAAAEQVSKNVSVVATGADQMQTSIREIAKSSTEAAKIAKNAVRAADSTNHTIGKLGESSLEIGKVIKVITSIAQQTNLLALNATIEAARAGEAGKGFAVVANEVKELAKETAKATEDIGQKIEAIQSDTKGAVQAIAEIGAVINQVNDISNTIASAVEEQTVTTNEIGRNVAEAARGTSDIARNISGVAQAAQNTTQGASDSQKAASSLSVMAAQLQGIVAKFKL